MPIEATDGRTLNRRQLLILAAAVAAGCGEGEETSANVGDDETASTRPATSPAAEADVFDVGPLDGYDVAAVYTEHRDDGFFVIRRDGEVYALSAVCTHKGCLVSPKSDGSFKCYCHGSEFSPQGKVLSGPAQRDWPRLAVKLDDRRHVLVDQNRMLDS